VRFDPGPDLGLDLVGARAPDLVDRVALVARGEAVHDRPGDLALGVQVGVHVASRPVELHEAARLHDGPIIRPSRQGWPGTWKKVRGREEDDAVIGFVIASKNDFAMTWKPVSFGCR